MDALTGAPAPAQPHPASGAAAGPLIPGQVVSARVIQALAADTFLLAVRGQTLVAHSPTPLPLDTVVQLAVQSGGSTGEPVSVRLLPVGTALPLADAAPALPSARAIAAQLGLPDIELSAQVVLACQRHGVPLRPATVAPLLRLLQAAQEPSLPSDGEGASPEATPAAEPRGHRTSMRELPQPELPAGQRSAGVPATPGQVPRTQLAHQAPQALQALQALQAPQVPRVMAQNPASDAGPTAQLERSQSVVNPSVARALDTPARLPARVSERVVLPPPSTALPAASLPGKPGPAIVFTPVFPSEKSLAPAPNPGSAAVPAGVPQPPPAMPVAPRHAVPAASELQPARLPALALTIAAQSSIPSLRTSVGAPVIAVVPVPVPVPVPASASAAPALPVRTAPTDASEPVRVPVMETRRVSSGVAQPPSSSVVRAVAALPPAVRPDAVARLAASALPPTAALLPLAAIAVQATLPRSAQFLAPRAETSVPEATSRIPVAVMGTLATSSRVAALAGGAEARSGVAPLPTAVLAPVRVSTDGGPGERLPLLPGRESVDLAHGPDPRPAIRQGFALAGLVLAQTPAGEAAEPPSLARLLTELLSRVAATARADVEPRLPDTDPSGATAATRAASTAPVAHQRPGADLRDEALPLLNSATAALEPAQASAGSRTELAAVHEHIARDLLPPQELAEYERVLALPLAIAGQPLPARLAVTTRRSATGAQACWMRLDCELSRLGPVSVRLGGVEGAPVAITLVARPAAATELAAALPQLTQDLHHLGVEAALRVVAEDEMSS